LATALLSEYLATVAPSDAMNEAESGVEVSRRYTRYDSTPVLPTGVHSRTMLLPATRAESPKGSDGWVPFGSKGFVRFSGPQETSARSTTRTMKTGSSPGTAERQARPVKQFGRRLPISITSYLSPLSIALFCRDRNV
jgi:hypothetical protein